MAAVFSVTPRARVKVSQTFHPHPSKKPARAFTRMLQMVRREPPTRGGRSQRCSSPFAGCLCFLRVSLTRPKTSKTSPTSGTTSEFERVTQVEVCPNCRGGRGGHPIKSASRLLDHFHLECFAGEVGEVFGGFLNFIEGVWGNAARPKPGQCALRATLRASSVLAAEAARGRSWARSRAGIFMAITLQQPHTSPRFSPGLLRARPNASPCAARRRPRRCCSGHRRPTRRRGHRGSSGRRRSLA